MSPVILSSQSGGGHPFIDQTRELTCVSGLNRICVYNTTRGDYTLTVSASQLCPLTPR